MSPKQTQYTERINVFFSPEQLEKIKANAYRMGINVSAYIRMVVVEKINQSTNSTKGEQ